MHVIKWVVFLDGDKKECGGPAENVDNVLGSFAVCSPLKFPPLKQTDGDLAALAASKRFP